MKVIVTGASGVLGSAVYDAFRGAGHDVLGLCFSNPKAGLKQLDLLDEKITEEVWAEFKPELVIHCAAERRPDVAEQDPARAERLNAHVPSHLASLSSSPSHPHRLIYISTDYVFPGTHPPYYPSSTPEPLNFYGRTKLAGEKALDGHTRASSLRVPVLYGPCKKPSDSAINILVEIVQDQSGKQYKMDDWQVRYPTNVLDVASFLVRLSALEKALPPIIHYTAPHVYTKFTLCQRFASLLSVPMTHITADVPDPSKPNPGGATRPKDCRLSMKETDALFGLEGEAEGASWKGTEVGDWFGGWFKEKGYIQ